MTATEDRLCEIEARAAAALRAMDAVRPNHASVCRCGSCSQHKRTVIAITAALTPAEAKA